MHFPRLFNIEMQIILVSQTKLNLLRGELKIKKSVVQYWADWDKNYVVINDSLTFSPLLVPPCSPPPLSSLLSLSVLWAGAWNYTL